ncbi:hypothetical protein HPB47_026650 [Ixodes persulcatus]|uniref:Uncharacterized protein n=1 Tax=Ixodes persulcatus TaxID=34615 RepID=A0AC60PZL6_IXOPE|nr:hypothetical protein HPB47_026650 [Ixodes persulcatus]
MSTPTKAQCFSLNVPADTPVDAIMDSIQARKGSGRWVTWKSPWSQWEPTLCLCQFLAQYGKVKAINPATFRDHQDFRTDTRVVKMEMSSPVPNFVHIQGHRVMADYRGLRRCKTPRCDRCGVFGHATAGCRAPCQRCGRSHATTECVQRRPGHAPRSESLPPSPSQPPRIPVTTRTRRSARGLHTLPLLSRTTTFRRTPEFPTAKVWAFHRTRPGRPPTHSHTWAGEPAWLGVRGDATLQTPAFTGAPCGNSQASRVLLNAAATPDSQTSDALSNAAATLEFRSTDVDDLSDDSDRLFIRHALSTPEASTTTTPRESSAETPTCHGDALQ